jgi:hypothetical protein
VDGASDQKASDTDSHRVLWIGAVCAIGIIATAILYLFDPTRAGFYAPCLFHRLTGLYCPGCGSTRAMHQLLHGHVILAFRLNPLMVLSLPFVAYGIMSQILSLKRGWRLPEMSVPSVCIWIYLGIVLVFGIARNIPIYPLSLLAP